MDFKRFNTLPSFGTNTYLVWDKESREAILIDPGAESAKIIDYADTNSLKVIAIVNTHGHADHIGGNRYFQKKWNIPIWIHKADADKLTNPQLNLSSFMGTEITSPAAERLLTGGDKIKLGRKEIDVIYTPGHTIGGICLHYSILLFSGDTLFQGSVGRTDFPDGNYALLEKSIREKLYQLPDETLVLPGHTEETRIGIEKRENPFVRM